jgi:hypothetical protein
MQSKGEVVEKGTGEKWCWLLASLGWAELAAGCLVLVISFGLARFENRGTRCQPVGGRGLANTASLLISWLAMVRTDWNANCRDITMLEYYQSCVPWSWVRMLMVGHFWLLVRGKTVNASIDCGDIRSDLTFSNNQLRRAARIVVESSRNRASLETEFKNFAIQKSHKSPFRASKSNIPSHQPSHATYPNVPQWPCRILIPSSDATSPFPRTNEPSLAERACA